LDVGCGNGGFLRAFHEKYPQWRLYGTEFDRRNENVLKKIPGFVRLYAEKNRPPSGQFHLISMVHVLEHLERPSNFLAGLVNLAFPGAKFLIEVPDAESNPFILPVADHVSHFDRRSLRKIAEKAGLEVELLRKDLVLRELTLIAVPKQKNLRRRLWSLAAPGWLKRNLDELQGFARKATQEARNGSLTVFGSSLGAAWTYGVVKGRVRFFLDEDVFRHGRAFLGREIQGLADGGARVVLPLAQQMKARVASKLRKYGWVCK
jgi:SAM-dependent methyltransferase